MRLNVKSSVGDYDVVIERGALERLGALTNLSRKALIVTDDGVPHEYAETAARQCAEPHIAVLPQGEGTKSFKYFEYLCSEMLKFGFSRYDAVIAVGGGVIGDLAAFAAASYMRGIDFINAPTTALSQIDSSIGGKAAINLNGVKNIVGAFYPPKLVIIDSDTLGTLSPRQLSNGLIEGLKAGLIYDGELFELFFKERLDVDEIIERSLAVKKAMVEADEKEQGVRKTLNFGHTLGHGYESACSLNGVSGALLHGEAVAYGMLPMLDDDEVKRKAEEIYKRLNIPPLPPFNKETAFNAIVNDKKANGGYITTVRVKIPGEAYFKDVEKAELKSML